MSLYLLYNVVIDMTLIVILTIRTL